MLTETKYRVVGDVLPDDGSPTSRNLVAVCTNVLVQWPDDDVYSRPKLVAIQSTITRNKLCVFDKHRYTLIYSLFTALYQTL